jgi:beta-1,4-mannosyltransferase
MIDVMGNRATARLRVLQSFPGRGPRTNPYLLQLVDSIGERADVQYFSWPAAILGRWDVFHIHWPERLLRGSSPLRTAARRLLFRLLLLRLAVRRGAVVRTKHNLSAHDGVSPAEQRLLARLDRRTRSWIRLNPFTDVPSDGSAHLIPHGDYRSWYPVSTAGRRPGRLLSAGLVRPYKGVEELLGAFSDLRREDAQLRIAGNAPDPALAASVRGLAAAAARVSIDLRHVDDQALADEIAAAQLVVLPYRAVHNSGAALLALSLERPVLIPGNDATRWLQEEVGAEWVITYDGELTSAVLDAALAATAEAPTGRPRFRDRDWPRVAAMHLAVYAAAADRAPEAPPAKVV